MTNESKPFYSHCPKLKPSRGNYIKSSKRIKKNLKTFGSFIVEIQNTLGSSVDLKATRVYLSYIVQNARQFYPTTKIQKKKLSAPRLRDESMYSRTVFSFPYFFIYLFLMVVVVHRKSERY